MREKEIQIDERDRQLDEKERKRGRETNSYMRKRGREIERARGADRQTDYREKNKIIG